MRLFFFIAAIFVLCAACGTSDHEIVYDKPPTVVAYSFFELKNACGKCHPGNGVVIPADEAAFRGSEKVKSEIEGGDMPPAASKGDFDKARALAFFK